MSTDSLIRKLVPVLCQDLGLIRFKDAWDHQERLFSEVLHIRQQNESLPACEKIDQMSYLLFCEHPHVYTLGKSGNESNLLVNEELLKNRGAEFFHINRGGDITYHGPGQIVGYPILDMETFGLRVKTYIDSLEEVIIRSMADFGIRSSRLDGATGVWLDAGTPSARKICAIGVRTSRWVTMHGFALNVNTDLSYFGLINPCGFTDKGVTSMEMELGNRQNLMAVKESLKKHFGEVFGMLLS
jgi:lipoyl(octanoyl) transferase